MMSSTADKSERTTRARGDAHPDSKAGTAIRWQAAFYRSYLADALQRLAADLNPDVQRIGVEMNQCLNCPSAERCADCPFNRGSANMVRGLGSK